MYLRGRDRRCDLFVVGSVVKVSRARSWTGTLRGPIGRCARSTEAFPGRDEDYPDASI